MVQIGLRAIERSTWIALILIFCTPFPYYYVGSTRLINSLISIYPFDFSCTQKQANTKIIFTEIYIFNYYFFLTIPIIKNSIIKQISFKRKFNKFNSSKFLTNLFVSRQYTSNSYLYLFIFYFWKWYRKSLMVLV